MKFLYNRDWGLEEAFENLIDSFIKTKVGLSDNFLDDKLSNNLKVNLLELYQQQLMVEAGTGNEGKWVQDKAVRSDSIYWLDRMNGNQHENLFFDIIEDFIKHLNMTCYTGITGCEFHYSMYPIGSFYLKHLDQFQDNSNRQYSLISYLNTDWQESDGGQLKIHQLDHDQMISPNQGKTVFSKATNWSMR
jgi:SM-20-related protein